jgi:hypothetical protein
MSRKCRAKSPVALHDPELMIETALAGVALGDVW